MALTVQQLRDRFETKDGSRPAATSLGDDVGRTIPLTAFSVLQGAGTAFEGANLPSDLDAAHRAAQVFVVDDVSDERLRQRIHTDIRKMLVHNPRLAARVQRMKPVRVDVVAVGVALSSVGFPRSVDEGVAGVFWDHPSWREARIGFRSEHLVSDPVLVVHEVAHALHRLAFTSGEQKAIDDVLLPVVGARNAVDELFAIYSEAEHLVAFGVDEKRAPGIYGWARRQWSDQHLFTRFVRKLYFPARPLAGDDAPKAAAWKKFSG